MNITHPDIHQYVEAHTSAEEDYLTDLAGLTSGKPFFADMLSGNLVGQVLTFLTAVLRPRRILEIGTFTGYSAICIARGMEKDASLVTIEYNGELEETIREYFAKAGFADQIDLRIGDAMEIVPGLTGMFDMVFIDADKKNYLNYYKLVFPVLNPGGIIIADNVLWGGKVIEDGNYNSGTSSIREFNEYVKNDPLVTKVMLPVRDGLYLIRKSKPTN